MSSRRERSALSTKAAETRARILDAALGMFAERGYEAATMRAIAQRAGVSPSNAYYYFRSKEELVQAFYARAHAEHLLVVEPALAAQRSLKGRLLAVMCTRLETVEPYHPFAGTLFQSAADPRSPLNPFSEESAPVRAEATEVFARAIRGSRTKIPADLVEQLPALLWTWHMSILLFWIHDRSQGRRRTHELVERTIDMIVKLLQLSRLPLMGGLRRSAVELLAGLREPDR